MIQSAAIEGRGGARPISKDQHHSIKYWANLWAYSRNTIIRQIANEQEGVLRVTNCNGKRTYTTYSMSESAAARVYQRLSHNFGQTTAAGRNPLRVVLLRGLDAGVAKKL